MIIVHIQLSSTFSVQQQQQQTAATTVNYTMNTRSSSTRRKQDAPTGSPPATTMEIIQRAHDRSQVRRSARNKSNSDQSNTSVTVVAQDDHSWAIIGRKTRKAPSPSNSQVSEFMIIVNSQLMVKRISYRLTIIILLFDPNDYHQSTIIVDFRHHKRRVLLPVRRRRRTHHHNHIIPNHHRLLLKELLPKCRQQLLPKYLELCIGVRDGFPLYMGIRIWKQLLLVKITYANRSAMLTKDSRIKIHHGF